MTIPLEQPPIELHVYAEQDSNTGIWTIDIPEWHIYSQRASGSLEHACQCVLNVGDLSGFRITYHTLGGDDLVYNS